LLQVVQVPFFEVEPPIRNWPAAHVGCATQVKPLVRPPHDPVRYSPLPHSVFEQARHVRPSSAPVHEPAWYLPAPHSRFPQVVQVPRAVADAALRYSVPLLHEGWLAQLKPSDVPLHEPVRYSLAPQSLFEQPLH